MKDFAGYGFPPSILKALDGLGFHVPTPVQAQAIPPILAGRDVRGLAQTGTGKTGAFAIPAVVRLMETPEADALILAPTRELAMQIHAFVKELAGKNERLRPALLIGGGSIANQTRELRKDPRIFIATPGRLVDHLRSNQKFLRRASILVLDEADRMLDMGFLPQLRVILRYLPKQRQTLMFSATFPSELRAFTKPLLHKPVELKLATGAPASIKHEVIETTRAQKNEVLLDELVACEGSVLVFVRSKVRAEDVYEYLESYAFQVARLHGDRTQAQRTKALKGFAAGEFRILVATDVAARGLDVENIAHVIHYDLPQVPEDFIHRSGRTGRNGRTGRALCLLAPEDRNLWRVISRDLK